MDAVEFVKQHTDFEVLLRHYNARSISVTSSQIRCCCPIHNGDNPTAFVYNKDNNLWYCHTGCDTGGSIIDFVMQIEGLNFKDSIHKIADIFNLDLSTITIVERTTAQMRELKAWLTYMRNRKKQKANKAFDLSLLGYTIIKPVVKYRTFTKETLEQFQCMLVDKIDIEVSETKRIEYPQRLILPIYFETVLVGVMCRKTKSVDRGPKWAMLPEGIETGQLLYNYDTLTKNKPIMITEGAFDVWNLTELGVQNVVSSFGAHLTPEQIKLLQKVSFDLILAFDPDKAGVLATLNAIEQIKDKFNVKIFKPNTEKDPGDLTKEDYENAKIISITKYIKEVSFDESGRQRYKKVNGKWKYHN